MYKTVIGLEVHCELKSNSKNFSSSKNSYSTIPNSNVSVVDLGMPGILPVVNKEAVKNSIKMALAMNCKVPEYLTFERKNYFYPDLPKGYQITQFKNPIGTNGYVMIHVNGEDKKILIHDTHLEEDTASLDHYNNYSLLDYNRCGVPLLETVTEPCLNSADEAVAFLEELRSIFLYTDTSYARSDSGGKIVQETRRYDENENTTYTMRSKEDAIDYKYFTEPNLPPIKIDTKWVEKIKEEIPTLPNYRFSIYTKEYSINEKDAYTIVRDKDISDFYEECVSILNNPVIISNWLTGDVMKNLNRLSLEIKDSGFTPKMLTDLIKMIDEGKISGKQAKGVLEKAIEEKQDPVKLVDTLGISQITSEDEIREIVLSVLNENPNLVEDFKNGKKVFDYLIGQIMKKTRGRANPVITSKILKEELERVA